jgi:TPR repeat protein
MYMDGIGVPADAAQARAWLQKAADQGDHTAQNALAVLDRLEQSPPQAPSTNFAAVEHPGAAGSSGVLMIRPVEPRQGGPDYASASLSSSAGAGASAKYLVAAQAGSVDAERSLGAAYMDGAGVRQDDAQAFAWLSKAAQAGDAASEERVGALYLEGRSVAKDYGQAMRWFQKAADQGNVEAERLLAFGYLWGLGVGQDRARAIALYQKAAAAGDAEARAQLRRLSGDAAVTSAAISSPSLTDSPRN